MPPSETEQQVQAHYNSGISIYETLIDALKTAGKDIHALTPRDLAPADHFHSGGWRSTLGLANMAGIRAGDYLLDVGGGVGGPARYLAAEIGCTVEVLDLSPEFVRAGEQLTELLGLSDKVHFHNGSALEMPYIEASFDAVITQHSSMNIPDKQLLYREIARVLKPGGMLAMHEFMAGVPGEIRYPLPWASTAGISSMELPDTIRGLLSDLGFDEAIWQDVTAQTLAMFREQAANSPAQPPALGLHLIIPAINEAIANLGQNMQAGNVVLVQAVFLKR
ncbi:MAG: methyltransferase domain-containing protein [Anaerolineae bacterium]|nr:methyltransferase domain-containing protein [Anaerolineae bacterium]